MDWFPTQDHALDLAQDALTAVTGSLTGSLVALVKNNITLDANTTMADITANEADYNTYAQAAITWLAPSIADDGQVEVVGTVPEFRPTDALAPNNIYGASIINAGAIKTYFNAAFDGAPLPMNTVLDSLILTVRWRPQSQMLSVTVS
jgi:hypothetical protein